MTELKVEDHQTRFEEEGPWKLRVTSYKLGDKYICTVDNVSPGANLVRREGATREEAESAALAIAREKVRKTRIVG